MKKVMPAHRGLELTNSRLQGHCLNLHTTKLMMKLTLNNLLYSIKYDKKSCFQGVA